MDKYFEKQTYGRKVNKFAAVATDPEQRYKVYKVRGYLDKKRIEEEMSAGVVTKHLQCGIPRFGPQTDIRNAAFNRILQLHFPVKIK